MSARPPVGVGAGTGGGRAGAPRGREAAPDGGRPPEGRPAAPEGRHLRQLRELPVSRLAGVGHKMEAALAEPDFLRGEIHTTWLDEFLRVPTAALRNGDAGAATAALIAAALWQARQDGAAAAARQPAEEPPSRWKIEGRRRQLDREP